MGFEKKYGIVETKNVQVVDYNYDLGKFTNETVGEDGIASVSGSYMKAYTGGDRITDFRGFKEAGNKYFSSRNGESYKYFRISREKAGITTGTITHNATPFQEVMEMVLILLVDHKEIL